MTAQHGIDARRCAEQRELRQQPGVGQAATKAARYVDHAHAPMTLLQLQTDANEALDENHNQKWLKVYCAVDGTHLQADVDPQMPHVSMEQHVGDEAPILVPQLRLEDEAPLHARVDNQMQRNL